MCILMPISKETEIFLLEIMGFTSLSLKKKKTVNGFSKGP